MRLVKAYAVSTLILSVSAGALYSQNLTIDVESVLQFAERQLTATVAQLGDTTKYPYRTLNDSSWITSHPGSWVSGWFPGCLWRIYEWNADDAWRWWAESWTAGLEETKYNTRTHDVGFIIFCSFGNGYRLTDREDYREVIIQAARSLATRFHPTVGCIRSWNSYEFPVIIDNMMNLEILFWASKNGGEAEWYDMAVSHALRTREDHIRPDGSTYQIVDYDTTTGDILQWASKQGYATESTWARGQAWGLYGFAMAFRETGDARFLETAEKLANYFIDNLPEDHVPFWDFQVADIPGEEKDVSAAAIAVSGLLELMILVPTAEQSNRYRTAAYDILASLCSPDYLAEGFNSCGILLHGVQNHNKDKGIDVSLIYADYYFIEALLRYQDVVRSTVAFGDPPYLLPSSAQLYQNYPNPFNPTTTLWYWLPDAAHVTISLYDVTGRWLQTLEEGVRKCGHHELHFQDDELASGTYILVLETEGHHRTRKMTLLH